jgi:hypothetical protein
MKKDIIKAKAKALRVYLETQGLALNHSASLEAVARIEGASSYNVLLTKMRPPEVEVVHSTACTQPRWDVEVCRIGYANATVVVRGARTRKEAEARALDEADSECFSEKSSDYVIVGKETAEPAKVVDTYEGDVDLGPRDWDVSVCRVSYGTNQLRQLVAPTMADAEELALDEAGNHEYSTSSCEYEVFGAFPRD